MIVTYTGKLEPLDREQKKKLDERYAKLAKLLGKGGQKTHVILSRQRHMSSVEITVNYLHHEVAGQSKSANEFTSLITAIDKVEKQVLKLKEKRREPQRHGSKEKEKLSLSVQVPKLDDAGEPTGRNLRRKVYVIEKPHVAKPITVEEAIGELAQRGYVVYRDAETNEIQVLVQRTDGHFDLVQGF
jgi:ribosomal subunit interface protein